MPHSLMLQEYGPVHEILVFVPYVQKPSFNAHADIHVHEGLDGGGGGVWYSLFIKNLAHYSSN